MSSDEVSMPAALALVIHELATNSAKYGSLSVASGTLDVSCNAHGDEVVITWTERGGPSIRAPAMLEGFGKGPHHPRRREGAASFGQCFHSGRSASSFDGAGCALLTGSDAGNVPSRPSFNLSCVSCRTFLLRIFGVLIFWRRVEFLRHSRPPMSGSQRLLGRSVPQSGTEDKCGGHSPGLL